MSDGAMRNLMTALRRASRASGDARLGDLQLLERFVRSGDEAAFNTLLARHGPMVLGVCRRVLGSSPAAEDVFQATFLALASRPESIRRESVGGWLYGVAR